jgi:hypothetical protein
MNTGLIPISTLIGEWSQRLCTFAIWWRERARARVGTASQRRTLPSQPDPLPIRVLGRATIERLSQKLSVGNVQDNGVFAA